MAEPAFQPNWFSEPGDTLSTLLSRREMTPDTLADCMGRDASVVHGLLSGSTVIDKSIAGLLSKCVGGSPSFWSTRQCQFEQDLNRAAEAISIDGDNRGSARYQSRKWSLPGGYLPRRKPEIR